jgi:hypothetical protein
MDSYCHQPIDRGGQATWQMNAAFPGRNTASVRVIPSEPPAVRFRHFGCRITLDVLLSPFHEAGVMRPIINLFQCSYRHRDKSHGGAITSAGGRDQGLESSLMIGAESHAAIHSGSGAAQDEVIHGDRRLCLYVGLAGSDLHPMSGSWKRCWHIFLSEPRSTAARAMP